MVGATLLATFLFGAVYRGFSSVLWRVPIFELPTFTHGSVIPEGPERALVVVYLAVTAGVIEEIFFRGLPWLGVQAVPNLNTRKAVYITGTSILFGLIHWENGVPEILATTALGLVAAVLYLKLLNLLPLIGAHIFLDLVYFW